MKKLAKYAFVNNKIVPSNKVAIHPYDLGFMRGMAVFDFLKFKDLKAIFLKDHVDRLFNSAKVFGILTILSKDEYIIAVNALINKNKQINGTIRIILSAGPITEGFKITEPQIIILIEPYYELPEEYFNNGIKIITLPFERNYAGAKHTNYAFAGINESKKQSSKALEILYVNDKGFVREPSTSNIAIVKNNTLYIPKSNVLEGITLKYVIKCAKKIGVKYVIKDFKIKELLNADEVFITATNKDVLPVVKVDSNIISNGKPGEVTKRLLITYRALINSTN
jgi:branched-chain amino acid aminotransferase